MVASALALTDSLTAWLAYEVAALFKASVVLAAVLLATASAFAAALSELLLVPLAAFAATILASCFCDLAVALALSYCFFDSSLDFLSEFFAA